MRITYRPLSHCLWLLVALLSWPSLAVKTETYSGADAVSTAWVVEHVPTNVSLRYPELVTSLYSTIRLNAFWEDSRVRASLEQQINVIALAEISPWFEERARNLSILKREERWRSYDVVATDTLLAFLRYRGDLAHEGKAWLFGAGVQSLGLQPDLIEVQSFLDAWEGNYLYSWLEGKKPFGDAYANMLDGILTLQALEARVLPVINGDGVLRPGDTLYDTAPLIELLVTLGDLSNESASYLNALPNLTEYHPLLVQAVKHFQLRHGLADDGAIGPKTRQWLNTPAGEKVRLMALNMERLRLWTPQRHNMLVVNIPDYGLTLWKNDEVEFQSKVIVGRPSRRTPLLYSQLDTVVFNPPWNVPESIMEKDILPKVKKDSSYLANNNYEIIEGWRSSQRISAESIDWDSLNVERFPYRLRQTPGNHNALGRYKFNMPNSNAIYLHDTPAKGLFNRSQRAFSSGCIRVEQAHGLAMLLMDRAGVAPAKVDGYRHGGNTKFVSVRRHVPVETIYQTAWVDDNKGLQFRTDIYKYDQNQRWPFDEELLMALGI